VRLGDVAIVRYGTQAERKEIVLTAKDVENVLNYAFSQRRQRWSMVDGRWSMVDGRWSMVDGRWSMVDGRWSMVDGRW